MRVRGRGVWWACAPAVAVVVAAFLLGAGTGGAASLANCTDSQLIPRVAEVLVSQGAPGYARLARGKETIVRAYLATPTNCTVTTRQSIAPFSATLDVMNGDSPAPAQLREYAPLSGKVGAATQIYSTADPFFVVPASYLAPTSINSFTANFTLTITYTRNGLATTYTTSPPATTKPVDQKTNALRVLVVPMGDPTSASIQWSNSANTPTGPTAEETLQNVMANAARAFPMPTGVTPALTASSTGGIRYVPGPTLLDVKSLGLYKTSNNVTKFCANGANWSTSQVTTGAYAGHTLKADLLQRLADYNLLNTPPADVVLGVIEGAIAWKSTDNLGCDDGRATTPASKVPGQIAWVRVSTDPAYPTPLQMELMHPFGISKTGTFHSPNIEADAFAPDHGYNVLQRKVGSTVSGALGVNDHSIMNYNTVSPNPPYTKDNTLLEPTDWAEALCDLGGVASTGGFTNCTLSAALGTSQGVPATGAPKMYQISGILDGTGGVRVTDAKKVDGDVERGVVGPTDDSRLHLLLCVGTCSTASNSRKDVKLALLGGEGHIGESIEAGSSFGALVSLDDGAWTCSALMLDGVEVFNACDDPTNLPNITSTSTVATGTVLADFTMPAGNGRAVAFDGNNLLYTTFVGDDRIYKFTTGGVAMGTISVGVQLGALALKPDNGHLYGGNYTGTGEVYDIDPSNGNKTTLFAYDDTPEAKAAACPFGAGLFKEIDGLERLPSGNLALSGDRCTRVDIKAPPGWNTVSSFNVPAGEDNAGITTDGADGLWLGLNTNNVDTTVSRLAHRDAAGNYVDSISPGRFLEDLAFDAKTFAPNCVVWGNTADEYPAHVLAYAVPCPSTGVKQGVAVKTENARFVSLQFTCGATTNPADGTPTFTLANGLRPDAGGEVVANYTNQLFCGESPGQIISTASNGWNWTGLSDAQATTAATGTSTLPTVNVASPLNGGKYRRGEFLHLDGSASDASDGSITGAQLQWSDDRLTPTAIGTGQSTDFRLPATAPLGDHHITLTATDGSGHSSSRTVTITIGPALCPSTSKCP